MLCDSCKTPRSYNLGKPDLVMYCILICFLHCLLIHDCVHLSVSVSVLLLSFPGCTLLFYETYGKGSPEQELSPRYALLAEDSIVQAVPEHPKKENIFCLSNSYGDIYLFQVKSVSYSV